MTSISEIPRFPFQSAFSVKAHNAFEANLAPVITAHCHEFGISRMMTGFLVLVKTAAACQGAAYILDEKQRQIPLAFNGIMLAPPTSCTQVAQHVADMQAEIQCEFTSLHTQKMAAYQAKHLSHYAQRKELESELKIAAENAARLAVLCMQLAGQEQKEPQQEDFLDVEEKSAAKQARITQLAQARAQAKIDGDIELAKVYGKHLSAVRREEVPDFHTAHARWQSNRDLLASEVARLDGAFDREAHVRLELAAVIADPPKEPIAAKLVYCREPISTICKLHSKSTFAATAIVAGDSVLKSFAKQATAIAELLGHRPATRANFSPISFFGATTPAAACRDVKALTADDAAWLSLFHFASDSSQNEPGFDAQLSDPDLLSKFDSMLKEPARKRLEDDFVMQEIVVAPEAIALKARVCEDLRVMRVNRGFHPFLDAYLARMPITMCVVAGLLYLARGETGLLPATTMQNAIDICQWLAEEFERAVVPIPEMSPEIAETWVLRRALYGHVDKVAQAGRENPFSVAMSALFRQSASIGLTKAVIRRAVVTMESLGWVRILPDGLDNVIELNMQFFDSMHRQ